MFSFVRRIAMKQFSKHPSYLYNDHKMSTNRNAFHNKRVHQSNPGLNRRLDLFKGNKATDYKHYDVNEEDIEDLESDFSGSRHMYDTRSEVENLNENRKLKMIKQKYFKEAAQPNFLTWAEKEQIRHLYETDPLVWSFEKLAQSFPASEKIIKKISTSKWEPRDSHKMLKHDQSVERNWKSLLDGNELNIDSHLKAHLLKFSNRRSASLAHRFVTADPVPQESNLPLTIASGEFSNIIVSYNNKVKGNDVVNDKCSTLSIDKRDLVKNNMRQISNISKNDDTPDLNRTVLSNKHYTLEKYRQDHVTSTSLSKMSFRASNEVQTPVKKDLKKKKMEHSKSGLVKNDMIAKIEVENCCIMYSEIITIPKDKWVKGGTYKVDECYYDDDGELLYRIPGIK